MPKKEPQCQESLPFRMFIATWITFEVYFCIHLKVNISHFVGKKILGLWSVGIFVPYL